MGTADYASLRDFLAGSRRIVYITSEMVTLPEPVVGVASWRRRARPVASPHLAAA
jgi:hypothetical protein